MLSTGTSLVLNYGQLEVDTGGLPPGLQNEEGKRIVGIILICCGFVSMGISALMGALYFTVCSRPKPPRNSVTPNTSSHGSTTARSSRDSRDGARDSSVLSSSGHPRRKGHNGSLSDPSINKAADNYSVPASQPSKHKPKRSRKKRNNHNLKHGMYKTPLTPHQEYDEEHVVRDDIAMTDSVRSIDSSQTESTDTRKDSLDLEVRPSVVISVTSIVGEVKPFLGSVPESQTISSYTDLLKHVRTHDKGSPDAVSSDSVIQVESSSDASGSFQTTGL